jgi:CRP-like cAMP-binding protein
LFTPKTLQRAFAVSPRFASNLFSVLQDQARYQQRYATQVQDGLSRLSASLLSRSSAMGQDQHCVVVTQAQLATETGLSRQWVNRLLKELESKGIAQRRRGRIVLHAPSRLSLLSG